MRYVGIIILAFAFGWLFGASANAAPMGTYVDEASVFWEQPLTVSVDHGYQDPMGNGCGDGTVAYVWRYVPYPFPNPLPWTVFLCRGEWRRHTGEQQCWVTIHELGHELGKPHARRGLMREYVPDVVRIRVCQKFGPKEGR